MREERAYIRKVIKKSVWNESFYIVKMAVGHQDFERKAENLRRFANKLARDFRSLKTSRSTARSLCSVLSGLRYYRYVQHCSAMHCCLPPNFTDLVSIVVFWHPTHASSTCN